MNTPGQREAIRTAAERWGERLRCQRLTIHEDGTAKVQGEDMPWCQIVARNDRAIVLKEPGRTVYYTQWHREYYSPQVRVFLIVSDDHKGLAVEEAITWETGRKK